MHPRIIFAIVRKDLVDAAKNMYLLFAIVLPVGMSVLFRFIFPSDTGSSGVLDIAIYDAGKSQLVQYLTDSKQFSSIFFAGSAEEVRRLVEKDRLGGLVIPANFDADVAAGKQPELQVYFNAKRAGYRQGMLQQLVEGGLRRLAGQTLPVKLVVTDVSAAPGETQADFSLDKFYLNLFLVMSLTMVGVFVVPYILVEEKEKHTLKALLVSPASYADVVIGKALVGLFYALLVAFVLMALNQGFAGNVVVTGLALLLGSVFLVQVGLMGAAFKATNQVNSWSSIVMLILMLPGMFGDFLAPPEPIPTMMKLIPTSYMASAVRQGMANTATPSTTLLNLGVLALGAVVAFAAVIWLLRREQQ